MRRSITQTAIRILCGIALWALALPAFAVPERVIDLQGTSNTRDIGGYSTTDGRVVEYGQILRSDKLSRLTADDFAELEAIGVKTVIDLRTQREHDHDPTVWQGEQPPRFIHLPIGDADDPWYRKQNRMVKSNRFSAAQSTDQMIDGYRMIADVGVNISGIPRPGDPVDPPGQHRGGSLAGRNGDGVSGQPGPGRASADRRPLDGQRCLHPVGTGNLRQVDTVVHDERYLPLSTHLPQQAGSRKQFAVRQLLITKLNDVDVTR